MPKARFVLLKFLKTFDGLTEEQLAEIVASMEYYATEKVIEYRDREIKSLFFMGIKTLPKLRYDNFILWVRKQYFRIAKKQAILRANTENYKCYVIRESMTRYKVLSTADVKFNKNIRLLDKNATAKNLHEIADFVAYPKK